MVGALRATPCWRVLTIKSLRWLTSRPASSDDLRRRSCHDPESVHAATGRWYPGGLIRGRLPPKSISRFDVNGSLYCPASILELCGRLVTRLMACGGISRRIKSSTLGWPCQFRESKARRDICVALLCSCRPHSILRRDGQKSAR